MTNVACCVRLATTDVSNALYLPGFGKLAENCSLWRLMKSGRRNVVRSFVDDVQATVLADSAWISSCAPGPARHGLEFQVD